MNSQPMQPVHLSARQRDARIGKGEFKSGSTRRENTTYLSFLEEALAVPFFALHAHSHAVL